MTRRILKYGHMAMLVAALSLMSSCSVFKRSTTTSGDTATVVESTSTSTKTSNKEQTSSKSSTKASASKTETTSSPLYGSLQGEWIITEAGKYKIQEDEDMPYVYFDEATDKFYASNGCNILNGEYIIDDQNEMAFDNVLSTMKACPDVAYSTEISSVLKDGNIIKIKTEAKDNATIAYVYTVSGKKLMTWRKHNADELNGEWIVTQIGQERMTSVKPNIFLDIPEKSVHGNTGCNYFNGSLYIDPNVSNSLSFSQMGVTKKACPNYEVEMSMLVALEQTSSYTLSGSTLKLLDSSKKVVMVLVKD